MTSGPRHGRTRELAISLAVAALAVGVIALTASPQGLAVASSSPSCSGYTVCPAAARPAMSDASHHRCPWM